jgi:hypothetical protein
MVQVGPHQFKQLNNDLNPAGDRYLNTKNGRLLVEPARKLREDDDGSHIRDMIS